MVAALNSLRGLEFVVIGGYAMNAYTLPRFSVDCDIVIRSENGLRKIEKELSNSGYQKVQFERKNLIAGNFSRYEKILEFQFIVSFDILVHSVTDRQAEVVFSADWVFEHSSERMLKGKTFFEDLKVRIIDLDALLAMKIAACRQTDIRDVFMMMPFAGDKQWIISEVAKRCNLKVRIAKILEKITSRQFQDGLSGVYGKVDKELFEKYRKAVFDLAESYKR